MVSRTVTFVPIIVFGEGSLVQSVLGLRSGLNWSWKPDNGAGQAMRTRWLLIRFVMERKGSGQTVVTCTKILLFKLVSIEPAPTEARLVMRPTVVGVTVRRIVAALLLSSEPRAPKIGLPFVARTPCEVVAESKTTEAGIRLVTKTFCAANGPLLVTMMV